MTNRTLAILVAILALMTAFIMFKQKSGPAAVVVEGVKAGSPLLANFDANQVAQMEIALQGQTAVVQKVNNRWVVASMRQYPADFAKLRALLTKLSDLTVGQVIRGGSARPAEFGLAPGGEGSAAYQLRLLDAGGKELAVLLIGQERRGSSDEPWAPAQGRYVQLQNGPVLLVDDTLYEATSPVDSWVDKLLAAVEPATVSAARIVRGAEDYTLSVSNGQAALPDLKEAEQLDSYAANRVAEALRELRFVSLAPAEVTVNNYATNHQARLEVHTAEGVVYEVQIGDETSAGSGYFARLAARYEAPAGETNAAAAAEAKVKELNAQFAPWIFVLGKYAVDPMIPARDQLAKKKGQEPASAPEGAGMELPPPGAAEAEVIMPEEAMMNAE